MRHKNILIYILVSLIVFPGVFGYDEVIRTPISDSFCENGSCITNIYSGVINYLNNSEYIPINSTIIPSNDLLYDYEVTSGNFEVYFKSNPTEAQAIKYVANNTFITFQPMGLLYSNDLNQLQQIEFINEVVGYPNENKIIYPNAYGNGLDLVYRHHPTMLKEELIINNFSDLTTPEQYIINGNNVSLNLDFIFTTNTYKIIVDGQEWNKRGRIETKNNISIYNDNNDLLYILQKPLAIDSNYSEQELKYVLDKKGSSLYVTIKTPYEWLSNSSRVFPVYIDPTTYYIPFAAYDYYVRVGVATYTGTTILRATDNQLVFPNIRETSYGLIDTSAIPDDDVISSAIFKFDANTYTATKGLSKTYYLQLWDGSLYNNVATGLTWNSGTNNVNMGATPISWINKAGVSIFRISVDQVTTNQIRTMLINAYETSQATAMRLEITHAPPQEETPEEKPKITAVYKAKKQHLFFLPFAFIIIVGTFIQMDKARKKENS